MRTYTVMPGDSISKIAIKYGISNWRDILAANPSVTDPDLIYVGQVLKIPTSGASSASGGGSTPVQAGVGSSLGEWVQNPWVWLGASVLTVGGVFLATRR